MWTFNGNGNVRIRLCLLYLVFLVISTFHNDVILHVHGTTTESTAATAIISSTKGSIDEEIFVNTCCDFQSLFKEADTSCSATGTRNSSISSGDQEPFGPFFKLPKELLTYVFEESSSEVEDVKFKLKKGLPSCSRGSFTVSVPLTLAAATSGPSNRRNGQNASSHVVHDDDFVGFTPNGYLKIGLDYYPPNEYCIDRLTENKLTLGVCHPTCDEKRPCITKCCDVGQVWDFEDVHSVPTCGPSGKKYWEPTLYSDRYTKMSPEIRKNVTPHYIAYHPAHGWCNYGHPYMFPLSGLQDGNHGILFRILHDGSVAYRVRRRQWLTIPLGEYCLDGAMNLFGQDKEFRGAEEDSVILFCHKEVATSETTISQVYGISMTISSLFLILTLIVFGLLWEKYKYNIQRWTIFFYVLTLLFMYFFFILSYFSFYFDEDTLTNAGLCRTIGIGMHFFFLSTFCWLTTVNFEIWLTVRAINSPVSYFNGFKRLFVYAVFGFGIPLVIVSVGLILESIYDSDIDSEVIIPEYGRLTCNIGSRDAFWVYMYGPVGFLLLSNKLFFGTTVYRVYQINNSVDPKQQRKLASLIRLFAILYLIMGVPWIFEVISFAAHEDEFKWYWLLFDLINIFQSIGIFIIFVCNRKTMLALEKKYPIFKRLFSKISLPKNMAKLGVRRKGSNLDDSKLSSIEIGGIEDCGNAMTGGGMTTVTQNNTRPKETIEMNMK